MLADIAVIFSQYLLDIFQGDVPLNNLSQVNQQRNTSIKVYYHIISQQTKLIPIIRNSGCWEVPARD